MTCGEAEKLVSAYVDRELDIATSLQIEAHLAACTRCAAEVEHATALREAIGGASLSYAPRAELAKRIRASIRSEARPRRTPVLRRWSWAAPAAAAAAAVLVWAVGVERRSPAGSPHLLDEVVAGHVRSLMVDHLVDVASSDQHTVRPWFNGKIDFAPPVVDFTASGFPLVGGRVDYLGGRPVAALVYRHRQHMVNVFIWPAGGGEPDRGAVSAEGYHLLRWAAAGLEYWAISDLNPHDLEVLADLIRQGGADAPASAPGRG